MSWVYSLPFLTMYLYMHLFVPIYLSPHLNNSIYFYKFPYEDFLLYLLTFLSFIPYTFPFFSPSRYPSFFLLWGPLTPSPCLSICSYLSRSLAIDINFRSHTAGKLIMVWHRIRDERETIQSLLIPRREMDWITRTPIDRKKRLIRENEGKDKRKMKIQKRLKQENYLNRKNILIAMKKNKNK